MILHLSDKLPKFGGAKVATERTIWCSLSVLCEYDSGTIGRALGVLFPVNIQAFLWAWRTISKYKPDVVHLHKINTLGIAPILAARLLGVPVVWSIYDYWMLCPRDNLYNPNTWKACSGPGWRCLKCYNPWGKRWPWGTKLTLLFRKRLLVWAANRCTRVIAISHASRKLLMSHGMAAHKIAVIRIGTPAASRSITKVRGLLVCIAAFGPAKGIHKLFGFIKGMSPHLKEVIIAGSGGHAEYIADITLQASQASIPVSIEYEPTDSRISDLLEMADYLYMNEQWENPGPLIIGEAVVRGALVLWADRGGIKECVQRVVSMDEMKEGLQCLYRTVSQG